MNAPPEIKTLFSVGCNWFVSSTFEHVATFVYMAILLFQHILNIYILNTFFKWSRLSLGLPGLLFMYIWGRKRFIAPLCKGYCYVEV